MVKTLFTSACLFGTAMLAPAADFYVSTTGRANGTGSITDPVDWATGMYQAKSPAKPGDTLWVRGGTYRGPFETYLYGQAGKPIIVRAYPGERVIVDGVASSTAPTLYIYGLHNIWWGIEVINSSTVRTPGVGRPAGVYMECAGGKLINCIIHDVGLGFGFWTPAVDGEMYGCLIYNVGFEKSDGKGNGHSVYSQNDSGTKKIHDNILCNSFGFGFNIYTEGQQIRGYDFQGNMSFNAGASSVSDHRYSNLFVGGYNPSARLNIVSNFTYTAIGANGAGARFSYGQPDNQDMVCTDNVFVGSDIAFQARYWQTVHVQRNLIYTSPSQTLIWAGPFNMLSGGSVWNNNQYYGVGSRSFQAGESTSTFYDFAGWKSYSGRDQNSTASTGAPSGVRTVVRPNKYEPKRGHVAIYNWDQLDRVAVDVSRVLQPGDRFEVRNAQNFFGTPVLSGTYGGGTILLPTTNLHAAAPTGMSKSNVKPDKTFNSYVIVGQSGPPVANTAPTITAISNHNTPEDSALDPVSFTVADAETSAGSLLLSASSSNPTLVPDANITFGGLGGNRTVTLTPAANLNGSANITVTVSDGLATASRTFTVTVSAVNDAPTITAVSSQTTSLDTPTSPIAFAVGDAETATGSLNITGTSSDQNLVPISSIVISGNGANRTVTITPASGRSGTATITLSVSDGALAATSAFTLTVTPGNTAPTISDIANRSAGKGQTLAAIPFTVGDGETSPGSLGVTATSANQALVPNSGLALGGSGANRTLAITPVTGQTGSVTITLTVTDNALTVSDSFTLTVTNVIVPPALLVAHWKFDEGSGSSALDSIGNHHGTLVNAPTRSSGVSSGALGFNGTSQYVTVPDANGLDVTTNFSVSLWFKPSALLNASSGRKDLLKKFTSYWLLMNYPDNDGKLSFAFNLGSPVVKSTTTSWAANQWCHAVATYGGGTMKLYVNGVLENSLATSVVPNVNSYTLEIGGNSNQDFYFGGSMDDVRLYGGALSAAEISTLYNESKPAPGANTAPTITSIANQAITAGSSTAAIPFTIDDAETAAGSLTLSASSSNTSLVPVANVIFGGGGANRDMTITPANGQAGASTITITVTDGQGATASDSFVLTVTVPNTPPTISAIGDQSVAAGANTEAIGFSVGDGQTPAANLSLSAVSSNPSVVPVSNVVFGGSGANRTVTVTPATTPTGSASITVTVSDGAATASRTFKVTSKKPAPPKGRVTVRKNGQGAVVPDLDGEELVIGQSYSLKAVPESGNLFAGWDGDVQSTGTTLSFVMASNLVLQANFMANPFIPAKGIYNGLFHETDAVRHETSGGFTLKLTDRGTYTASLLMGNRKLPFSGKFKLDGRATNAVHLNKTNVLTIEMSMPDDGSNDPISGRIYNDEWEAELLVDLATFHVKTNRAPFAGKYTLVLPSSNEPDAPAGDGFGRVTISAAGVVTLAGTLADGTKVSDSVTLSRAGEWPLYAPLYSGKGSVLSWMTFTNLDETDIAGALNWIRPVQPKAKFYTNGFAVQTEVAGSHYAAPESKTNRLIQIEAGTVTLTDGGLADALVNAIRITPNNKVTNLGTNKLSLTFTVSSGLFTGNVLNPETRKPLTFKGAVLQKQNFGAGFFPGTEGSGRLVLE